MIEAKTLLEDDILSYLDQHENKELMRFLTCGSVDDGKSTLIGRLLHDSKMIFEDHLSAIKNDSKKLVMNIGADCIEYFSNVEVGSEIRAKNIEKMYRIGLKEWKDTTINIIWERDDFAKEHIKKSEKEQGLESITSVITKLKKLIRGQWLITLENGQQWQQKDTAKLKLKVGDTILLKKAVMGAVYLYKDGSHRNIRVKRLK